MQPVIFRKIKLYHIILTVLLSLCAFFYYLWDYCEYGQTGIAKNFFLYSSAFAYSKATYFSTIRLESYLSISDG